MVARAFTGSDDSVKGFAGSRMLAGFSRVWRWEKSPGVKTVDGGWSDGKFMIEMKTEMDWEMERSSNVSDTCKAIVGWCGGRSSGRLGNSGWVDQLESVDLVFSRAP